MPTIVRRKFNVVNAYNFLDQFNSTPSIEHYLYMGIGKQSAWADDNLPPSPDGSVDERQQFWTDLIGVQKIVTTDVAMMVARKNWVAGGTYEVFDEADPLAWDTNFYVVNSEFNVYKLVSWDGITVAANEPTGHNNGANINTADGHVWKFMYDISLQDTQNLVNDTWIPVNVLDNISANQTSYGDVDAYKTLGAKHVLVRAKLEDTGLPVDVTYRQVGIIRNPYLTGGVTPATDLIYLLAALEANSGDLIHLENRKPITRNTGQSETVQLIVEF